MLLKEPLVGLVAGQPGAMDAGLLARPHADHLALVRHADGIGLGVLEGDRRHDEGVKGGVRYVPVARYDVGKGVSRDGRIVARLFQLKTV